MDESNKLMISAIIAVLAIVGLACFLSSSQTGYSVYTYGPCQPGEIVVYQHDISSGVIAKTVVTCAYPYGDNVVYSMGKMFPAERQRRKVIPRDSSIFVKGSF